MCSFQKSSGAHRKSSRFPLEKSNGLRSNIVWVFTRNSYCVPFENRVVFLLFFSFFFVKSRYFLSKIEWFSFENRVVFFGKLNGFLSKTKWFSFWKSSCFLLKIKWFSWENRVVFLLEIEWFSFEHQVVLFRTPSGCPLKIEQPYAQKSCYIFAKADFLFTQDKA